MTITIDMIKELRAQTFAPLGDCKDALMEANGDIELAKEILKKKGAIKADKKSDRETSEGVVKFVIHGDSVVGIKLLCETDFVARNEEFNALVDELIDKVGHYHATVDPDDVPESLLNELTTMIKDRTATIGEAMSLAGVYKYTGNAYVYNHGGSISAVVFYEGNDEAVAKSLALQIAAMNPRYISLDDVPNEAKQSLREEFAADESLANKPENIRDQIVDGKLKKAFQDEVLLEQVSIVDQTKKVGALLPADFVVQHFLRVAI